MEIHFVYYNLNMKSHHSFLIILTLLLSLSACKTDKTETIDVINWKVAQNYYIENIDLASKYLDSLKAEGLKAKTQNTTLH